MRIIFDEIRIIGTCMGILGLTFVLCYNIESKQVLNSDNITIKKTLDSLEYNHNFFVIAW